MILVTGMQRSGTSLLCLLLERLGISFGDPAALVAGDRWNPGGYYESQPVVDLDSRIITGLSRYGRPFETWLSKVAYLRMPGARSVDARGQRLRGQIEALGERYRACAVKDPRFCLTLRFWRQWADVQHVVICLRHPTAVVDSMARRHWLPRWLGARFYAWHVNALLGQLPAEGVQFVDVDRLVAGDAAELDLLRRGLGLGAGPASAELLGEVVRGELFGTGAGGCPRVAMEAWRRLWAAAARHRPAASGPGSR